MKKVMIFGTFDGLHEGHRAFFKEASAQGDYLIAVVAQDHIIQHIKGHLPQLNLAERFDHLKKEDEVDEVVIGDSKSGTWGVLKKYKPDIIALGYDQGVLRQDLEANLKELDWQPIIKIMPAYEPNKYHSSKL